MKKIVRISTAAFLAGVTTLAVTLPMPSSAQTGVQSERSTPQAARAEDEGSRD